MIIDGARVRAARVTVLELGERYTAQAVALLATPAVPADERLRLQAALDQLQTALRSLHSSTEVPQRGPSRAGHPPLAADSPWPGTPVLWLKPAR